jgi:sugar lactone lactonase YvrE
MIELVQRALDAWRGGGPYSVTVPPMDGALRPNQAIEEAHSLLTVVEPDNLTRDEGRILFSTGDTVMALDPGGGAPSLVETFPRPVSCLAAQGGCLAVGLEDGQVLIRGAPHDGVALSHVAGRAIVCPTAVAFADPHTLLLCSGSQQTSPADWKRDLMARNASGSVWRINLLDGSAACLADRLAYPYGIGIQPNGDLILAESWQSQLIRLRANASPEVVLGGLPGYPARLAPAADGEGCWLAIFAPRSQLVEFVLREHDYRADMMRECAPDHWVAPSLRAPQSFLEPLQGGALKQLGTLKPWAPSRSYGLLVRLDRAFRTTESFHSRANGTRHGVTSCIDVGGSLLATSKGGDVIVSIDLDAAGDGSGT